MDEPVVKRAKLNEVNDNDLSELVNVVWEHYRNFLDSIDLNENEGEGNQDADIDELQELIEITKSRITKPSLPLEKIADGSDLGLGSVEIISPCWKSRKHMIPILVSVSYYHLADSAISQYLMMQQQNHRTTSSTIEATSAYEQGDNPSIVKAMEMCQNLLVQSLEWYPYNAATWSMGANFGRMSQSLSLSSSLKWYEMAVQSSTALRERALEASDDQSIPVEEKDWIELLVLNQILGVEYEDDDDDDDDDNDGDDAEEHHPVHRDEGNSIDEEFPNETNERDKEGNNGKDERNPENDDGEMDNTGWYSSSTIESTSRFMCAMLLSMNGRHDRALVHLKPFRLTHRLHPNVWRIAPPIQPTTFQNTPSTPPLVFQPKGGIIPSHLYDSMTKLFAPDAAYWRESDYSSRGYYSFFHEFDAADRKQPCNLIEEVIINHLLPRAQQCLNNMKKNNNEKPNSNNSTTICGFEWWAHTRPIKANLGHNLHFDTDESMLDQEGKVTHPMLSSILYLTGANEHSLSPAGATIILDETPGSKTIGKKCWQGIPKDNTFLIFPGNKLHGVLPCPGIHKNHERKTDDEDKSLDIKKLMYNWKNQCKVEMDDKPTSCSKSQPNRLTFMVGFWDRSVPATMERRSLYGPCGPIPPATEEHTWVREIMQGYNEKPAEESPVANKIMTATALHEVSPAWEIIGAEKKDVSEVDNNNQETYPTIPHGIDHRFFVQGAPECFRSSLFKDRDVNNS